jgi:hypothetical protein
MYAWEDAYGFATTRDPFLQAWYFRYPPKRCWSATAGSFPCQRSSQLSSQKRPAVHRMDRMTDLFCLSAQEWRDTIFLLHCITPLLPPAFCDAYSCPESIAPFTACHGSLLSSDVTKFGKPTSQPSLYRFKQTEPKPKGLSIPIDPLY